jgi:glucose/arabinose dehydrogenase
LQANSHAVITLCLTAFLAACGGGGGSGPPAPRPDPDPVFPTFELVEAAVGFVHPTAITHAGDGSGRLFVVERRGTVRVVDGGVAAAVPFLDLRDRVTDDGSEQGLLGLAFAPDFAVSGYLYVNYTDLSGDTVIARFTAESDAVDAATEHVVLQVDQPFANHNGGQLAFGPEGYLYVALGDGGSGGDPQGHAQNLDSPLGKILRLDVSDPALPYAIPADNPFGDEIWAYGLRNPWRFSFDGATGDLYIADVGQSLREEINVQPTASSGGENYGWNIAEGTQCYAAASCDTSGFTAPIHEYDHGEGCSITGGYVTGGVYLYGDYCNGTIWGLMRDGAAWRNEELLSTQLSISTFGVGESGTVYLADYASGTLWAVE